MLVLLRMISWVAALLTLAGFFIAIRFPQATIPLLVILLLLVGLLIGRLVDLPRRSYGFWNFVLTPVVLLFSAEAFFLFLEDIQLERAVGVVTAFLILVYAEHLFYYFHQPSRYRAYTIERMSVACHLATSFLLASTLFGLLIFVHLPLWVLAPVAFLGAVFLSFSTLWVSKVETERAFSFAVVGAVLFTEMFVAISFLSTSHLTDAALLTLFLYLFLGLVRASFMERLTFSVKMRYGVFAVVLFLAVILSAHWL